MFWNSASVQTYRLLSRSKKLVILGDLCVRSQLGFLDTFLDLFIELGEDRKFQADVFQVEVIRNF